MPRFSCKAHPAALTGFICTLAMAMPTLGSGDGFRIMSEQEADAHRQTMASMTESAREAYRNAQYAQLRERAAANGYSLPATPPWREDMADSGGSVGGDDNMQADIIARHAAMRARLEAHRAATRPLPESASANTDTAGEPPPPEAAPTEAGDKAPTSIADNPTDTPATESAPQSSPAVAEVQADAPAVAVPQTEERPAQTATPTPGHSTGSGDNSDAGPAVSSPAAVARPAPPRPPVMPTPPRAPASPVPSAGSIAADSAGAGAETMAAYREQMRAKFDDFMKERQVQQDQSLRRQREQREAQMQQNRTWFQSGPRIPPYPYPSARGYSPRYPSTPPAYRSPYWQPQR